jgi:RNA 3'-phosphate cyclase
MSTLIDLDGSFGEGGGQILRTSLALSLLTGKPFHLRNVRANRSRPGLQPQHLMCVQAAAAISQAQTRGASRGSSDLEFHPGKVKPGPYRFDIGTAGATSLLLHTLYLPLALHAASASELTLIGGTHVSASPCFHFLDVTWRRYMALLGLRISLKMARPGFYPRGGGVVEARLEPCAALRGVKFEQRGPIQVRGLSAVASLPEHIAQRQTRRARYLLERRHGLQAAVREESWPGGPGTMMALELDTTPAPGLFFALGERGKPAEKVAEEAVDQAEAFLRAAPAAVDIHSADQIVLPVALAEGPSEYTIAEVTRHLTTNITVIRAFLDRAIVCEGAEGKPGRVRIA